MEPQLVHEAPDLDAATAAWRVGGERLALVPTMGALHEGHLALVRHAATLADRVVVTIFVNPTQFGPGEDFARYPRDLERDLALLAGTGADLVFAPDAATVYPPGNATRVRIEGPPGAGLEAAHRPGHFDGVATVVSCLFQLVRPQVAVFGQKDAQQLAVVRRLVRDLHFRIEIVGHPTLREADGLAMSSRNAYLDPADRQAATVLWSALEEAGTAFARGERRAEPLVDDVAARIAAEPRARLDYAAVVDAATFQPVAEILAPAVLPVAAHFGSTRLIDNLLLTPPDGTPE